MRRRVTENTHTQKERERAFILFYIRIFVKRESLAGYV